MCISGLLLIPHWALPYHPALFLHNSPISATGNPSFTLHTHRQLKKCMSEGKKRHLRFFFAEECLKSCFIFTQSQNLSLQSLFFLPHLISCRLVTSIRDLHCHHVSRAEDRTLPRWKYIQKTQLHKLGVNSVSQSELHLSSGILVPRAVSAQLSNVSNLFLV